MMESYLSNRHKLIITADDFGLSPRANRNIRYLLSIGKIDRIAIMAHGEISEKEIAELAKSHVKLDIHLDILHELGNNRKKRAGFAWRMFEFFLKILTRKITTRKIEADWENQIKIFRKLFGKNPDGINSHEHIHFFPPFFKVALNLRDKYSIPYIRIGDSASMPHNNAVSYILHFLRKINLSICAKRGCVSSGSLASLEWIEDIDAFLDNLPEGTIEIVCHPELAEEFVKIKKYF